MGTVFAVVLRSAVVVAVAVAPCVVAAAEMAVVVSAVEVSEIGVHVVHDAVAVVVAGLQVLPAVSAKEHCFVGD